MNKPVQITALAFLLAAAPAFGATAAPKAPAAKAAKPAKGANAGKAKAAKPAAPPSALTQAWTALTNELKDSLGGSDMVLRLDKVYGKELSAPTKAQLKRIFGDTDPSTFTRQANVSGGYDYRFALKPSRYVDPDGSSVTWSELVATESIDAAESKASGDVKWDKIEFNSPKFKATVNGAYAQGEQTRVSGDIWVGKGRGGVASIVTEDPTQPGLAPRFDNITYEGDSQARGKLLDYSIKTNTARISMFGEHVDDVRFNMRMTGLDVDTLKALNSHKKAVASQPGKELDALLPMLQDFARSARANGSTIELDEISLGFHGSRLLITGALALSPGVESDFETLPGIGRKVDGHLTMKVPTALIGEVSQLMARKQSQAANPKAPVNEAAVAQMAQGMRDMVIGKMMNEGYARMEGDTLVIDLAVKDGLLSINGKPVDFPPTGQKK